MSIALLDEIREMTVQDRLRLIGEIWEMVAENPEALPLSAVQEEELDRRLVAHGQNPKAGRTWEDVKRDLKSRL